LPDVSCDLLWLDGRVYVAGPLGRAIEAIGIGRDVSVLRLDPQVARHWLGVPLTQLANRVLPLADIDGRLSSAVAARFEAGQAAAIVALDRPAAETHPSARIGEARVRLRRGQRVGAVASALNLSERQLERIFADATGLTPRTYTRILRFRRALFAAGGGARLADAALDSGYADQAHLCRDVRDLTGYPLRTLLGHVGKLQDIAAGTL
jgi:AraC-like DNA-binding protein